MNYADPFGTCYDKNTHQERPCMVTWSDGANKNISARTLAMVHSIAEKANLDLTLSSGRREGSCSESLHNCGTAVDIFQINGHNVGDKGTPSPEAMPFVQRVQDVMKGMPDIRENFGPAGLFISKPRGSPQIEIHDAVLQYNHDDHVHAGGQRDLAP